MKQKTVRFLSFLSALCMVTTQSVPALAADSTQETNIAGKQSAIVNYEQASAFSVTIPKAIVLNESVTVIPDATVTLNDVNGKTPVTGTIDQVKTEFLCNEIAADDGCSTDGKITADSLTSGDWSGVFKFEIDVDKKIDAGLYDTNGVMLCSWEDSGINIEKNYGTKSSTIYYKTEITSPYYVLTKNTLLLSIL